MTRSQRIAVSDIVRNVDIGVLFVSLGFAYMLESQRNLSTLLNSLETHHPIQVFVATIVLAFAWQGSLVAMGLYRSRRMESRLREVLDIGFACTICSVFAYVWLWLISTPTRHSSGEFGLTSLYFLGISSAALLSTRVVARFSMHILRRNGRNLRNILIVGTNLRSDHLAREIALHSEWGYRVQGFIDQERWDETTSQHGPLLGGFDDIPEILRNHSVDEVIITLPIASFYRQMSDIVETCRDHGIAVHSIGTFFNQDEPDWITYSSEQTRAITLHEQAWDVRASLVKRIADILISSILLAFLAPILLIVAAAIKLTSSGPVLFCQTRLGRGKRPFQIFKFRTMVQNAEKLITQVEHLNETQGPTFKLKNDPRITPLGSFLRKTSLDELPQLINVLLGDMSLVGPRPLPLRDYQGFSQDWQRRRFSVKPGITCLWQVMGRSSIGFDEWMALDLRYIDQWSIWLDVKILLQTIPAVLRGSGAV